jgi:hypothetical protein
MIKPTVEYVGFRSTADRREYLLRSHVGPEIREYTVGITHAAFAAKRVRFQDGPEICYLRIQRELETTTIVHLENDFTISDAELADYLTTHTVPARRRLDTPSRPQPPVITTAPEPVQPVVPSH